MTKTNKTNMMAPALFTLAYCLAGCQEFCGWYDYCICGWDGGPCEEEEQPCVEGEVGEEGTEGVGDGELEGEGEDEVCGEISCVEGPLLCTDAVCVCNATAPELVQVFGEFQVQQWMNEGELGTLEGTCEGTLYRYGCLLGEQEILQAYHGDNNESWEVGQFWCAGCYNRSLELDEDNNEDNPPGHPDDYIAHVGGLHTRLVPMCVMPSDVVDAWPHLRPSYAEGQYDDDNIEYQKDEGMKGPRCDHESLDEYEYEIAVVTTQFDGPLCFGLTNCSLWCHQDSGCADKLGPLVDGLHRDAYCALPPFDPSNVQAACGMSYLNFPFVATPDLILDLNWDEEVSCIKNRSGGMNCSLSQAMLDDLVVHPEALLGGAFLELSPTGETIEVLDRNATSAFAKLVDEGDAIIALGTEWGLPTDPDVALRALSELMRQGYTEAVLRQGSSDVIYHITVVPNKLRK